MMTETFWDWRMFFLEITNRCNFECVFCPSGISHRAKQNMPGELALSVIDQLGALGFRGPIYFHVLGEPLLHPSVFPIVDHAAQAGMKPILFTNGGPLSSDVVEGILASRATQASQQRTRPRARRLGPLPASPSGRRPR
jgi:MoaA/NifB/PqqE/SkfB family radical SAM enzyme